MAMRFQQPIPIVWCSMALLVAGIASWVFALVQFWGTKPEYADRFLILLGSAYATYSLFPIARTMRIHPRPIIGFVLLSLGMMLHSLAYLLPMRGTGMLSVWLWLVVLALQLAVAGFVLARFGSQHLRHFAFPVLFVWFALQPPTMLLNPLQARLQAATTSSAESCLKTIGYEVKRPGMSYELLLPGGNLGVVETCSGVRSLTALTALAAFIAFWRSFGPVRGFALLVLSIPVVVATNILRVILSGIIQENFGQEAIRGTNHEILGFMMIFVGLGLIVMIANILNRHSMVEAVPKTSQVIQHATGSTLWNHVIFVVLLLGCGVSIIGFISNLSRDSSLPVLVEFETLPERLSDWHGKTLPIDPLIRDSLAPDAILHRRYQNNIGVQADIWLIAWSSPEAVRGYHHPDICLPSRGFEVQRQWQEEVTTPCRTIKARARSLARGPEKLTVLYWTQEGSRVWNAADEEQAMSQLGGLRGLQQSIMQLFDSPATSAREPRLVVLIGSSAAGSQIQRNLVQLAELLAPELERICPWTRPMP